MTRTSPPAGSQATEVGPPPPFDPECGAALAALGDARSPSLTAEGIPAQRAAMDTYQPPLPDYLESLFTVEDRAVPGPAGAPEISLFIARPKSATTPVPVLYFVHGGGMVVGDNRGGLPEILDYATELEVAVVSVEYRLAPEHPHPAPVEDCYAGLVWTAEHAGELGIDPKRIVVVGASAGGGLAAAMVLMARDRGGPALAGQMLACPMLDDRNDSVSVQQMVGLGVWDRTANETGWTALLGDARGGPDVSPYGAPARATDLSGLPPTFIDVGSAESFRDEDVAYASGIWRAGGVAELHVWPGGFHGYYQLAPHAQISKETMAARLAWLRRLLAP
jgi:acetyl esterase/lipase